MCARARVSATRALWLAGSGGGPALNCFSWPRLTRCNSPVTTCVAAPRSRSCGSHLNRLGNPSAQVDHDNLHLVRRLVDVNALYDCPQQPSCRPDTSLGASGVGRHRAPQRRGESTGRGPARCGTARRAVARGSRAPPKTPGVRVVSVFSRTLGRIDGKGGPPREGLNLWVLALPGSLVQRRMVDAVGKDSNRG
jgi:hypothetical protein